MGCVSPLCSALLLPVPYGCVPDSGFHTRCYTHGPAQLFQQSVALCALLRGVWPFTRLTQSTALLAVPGRVGDPRTSIPHRVQQCLGAPGFHFPLPLCVNHPPPQSERLTHLGYWGLDLGGSGVSQAPQPRSCFSEKCRSFREAAFPPSSPSPPPCPSPPLPPPSSSSSSSSDLCLDLR